MNLFNTLFSLSCVILTFWGGKEENILQIKSSPYQDEVVKVSTKDKALKVLQEKCNSCHQLQNKSVVFTKDNMALRAKAIRKQVFIKRRMPKSGVTLTPKEEKDLRVWVDEVLKN